MRLKFSLKEVTKSYGGLTVLNKCTQSFGPGLTAILGPSQSGKSTLMKICASLEPVSSGKVSYFYSSERAIKDEQYVMRKTTLVLPFGTMFNTTAWKNVIAGLVIRKVKGKERKTLAKEMLDKVGLYDKRNRNAFSLSRGECRRLVLARAVVTNPDIILMDEPFRGLDEKSIEIIEKILLDLKASDDPPTMVMATSDAMQATGLASKRIMLKRGTFAVSVSKDQEYEPSAETTGKISLDQLGEIEQDDTGDEDEDKGGEEPYINPEFFK
jgi:ABC-type multidrug transport system ATPase subunit